MSMCYWIIEGIGLNADEVMPYINKEKTARFLLEQLGDKTDISKRLSRMISSSDYSQFIIDSYLYGRPYDNFADLLTHCDDTDSITYGDDGNGNCYFYYPPSMPWEMRETEPKSIQEVHIRIIAAIQKISNLTPEEIEQMIHDSLYIVGCG